MTFLKPVKILSQNELESIHHSSLSILEETGIRLEDEKALRLFSEKGLPVDFEARRVRFPKIVIEDCLKRPLRNPKIFERTGALAGELAPGNCYVASGHNAIFILDYGSDKRRTVTKEDVGKFALIADYLQDIDVVGIEAVPQDVQVGSSFLHAVDAAFNNTQKHVYCAPDDGKITSLVIEMAKVVANADFAGSPNISIQVSPTSPLSWEKSAIGALIEASKAGVLLSIVSQPFTGVSSPYTLAGHIILHNVETLSGIIFNQLINPGSPVMYGSAWATFDMKQANISISSPETALMRIAGAQMASYYQVPYMTTAPESDAHVPDQQLSWEKVMSIYAACSADTNFMINAGMFDCGLTVSFEQLLIDCEMFSFVKRFIRGITVDEDRLAVDVIKKVGPGGNYLGEEHTLRFLGTGEHWEPRLSSREMYERWKEKGQFDINRKSHEEVQSILHGHKPEPLSEKKIFELKKIIETFERNF
jgi:trimethylamine--corrinoid protein Co-methyltransferase